MDIDIVVRTILPILLLIGLGYFSRKIGILKSGDERVLNAYVYYFALPALFLVDLSGTDLIRHSRFVLAGILPIVVVLIIYIFLYLMFGFSRNTLYLIVVSTLLGSLAFFGIPFIVFAFPEAENLASLSAASINIVSVPISIMVLEFHKLGESALLEGLKRVAKRFSKNPLIISIILGVFLSLAGIKIPSPIETTLHMLGITTAPVAIFLLGVFLYGRKYSNLSKAFKLSLLRIVFLPTITLLTMMLVNLQDLERTTIILMHGTPIAIAAIILSERYAFHKETVASLLLISSLAAGLYLNLWLLALGY